MQLKLTLPFLFIMYVGGHLQVRPQTPSENEIAYRVLDSQSPSERDPFKQASYIISVDQIPDRLGIQKLLCQVVTKQKPSNYSMLRITIYYNLKVWVPALDGDEKALREHFNHIVAQYAWNVRLTGKLQRLRIVRDGREEALSPPREYEFDHQESCKEFY